VARTVNPTTHAVRRDAFLDVAEQLIGTRGWDQVTVGDIIDAAGTSKGAFHRSFDLKEALLAAVILRRTDAGSFVLVDAPALHVWFD
jgi:AcrR family transcriptional regulator